MNPKITELEAPAKNVGKARAHINQNEGLIFEKSSPGKAAWKLPPLDVPEVDAAQLLGSSERKQLGKMPSTPILFETASDTTLRVLQQGQH